MHGKIKDGAELQYENLVTVSLECLSLPVQFSSAFITKYNLKLKNHNVSISNFKFYLK